MIKKANIQVLSSSTAPTTPPHPPFPLLSNVKKFGFFIGVLSRRRHEITCRRMRGSWVRLGNVPLRKVSGSGTRT
ncbi:hypothetical protein BgiBS90_023296, partial [Biomphalaria glabrata]